MKTNEKLNLTMLCDFYELTMGNGYFVDGKADQIRYFDVFFRNVPDGGGFAIAAGLEQVVEYIRDLHFSRTTSPICAAAESLTRAFLQYLRELPLHGRYLRRAGGHADLPARADHDRTRAGHSGAARRNVYLLLRSTTRASSPQRPTASSARRRAAGAGVRLPPGAGRRGCHPWRTRCLHRRLQRHGLHDLRSALRRIRGRHDGPFVGADVPVSEYEAFKRLLRSLPDNPALLVDTYNTLKSGVPNAIRVFNEVLSARGLRQVRHPARLRRYDVPDEKGPQNARRGRLAKLQNLRARIRLDEYIIQDTLRQGAQIDCSASVSGSSRPKRAVFGGVYKLSAVEAETGRSSRRSRSARTSARSRTRTFKKLYRFYGADTGKAIADYLCLHDETVNDGEDLEIFDPEATWKRKKVYNFHARELQVPVFRNGELVYQLPTLNEIRSYCREQVDTLWDEVKRFDNPHTYYVGRSLSEALGDQIPSAEGQRMRREHHA